MIKLIALLVLISHQSLALPPPRGTSLCASGDCEFWDVPLGTRPEKRSIELKNEEKTRVETPKSVQKRPILVPKTIKNTPIQDENGGNLPHFYHTTVAPRDIEGVVYVPVRKAKILSEARIGDSYRAVIAQRLKVSSQTPQPIRATVIEGSLKGSLVMGEAHLDSELKRIFLTFSKIRTAHDRKVYEFKGSGLALDGRVGIEGEYHGSSGKLLISEAITAFGAAALDSTIQRTQNQFGAYQNEPSLSNAMKSGAVGSTSRILEKANNASKNPPEFTEMDGFQEIMILVEQEAKEEI